MYGGNDSFSGIVDKNRDAIGCLHAEAEVWRACDESICIFRPTGFVDPMHVVRVSLVREPQVFHSEP